MRRRPDGLLEYLGRLDGQVKIRGFRIEPGEIEAVLASLPGVREAAVVVREGRSQSEPGDRRLVAYVAGAPGAIAADALRRSLQERLPDYMVPGTFVALAALPLTPNGKVDRKALPAPELLRSEESYAAPRTPVEELLAGIWSEVLGVERVGSTDHFFDLGGHSLLATQMMSRLRSTFGVELSLRTLFEALTLAELAARIEAALRTAGAGRLTPPLKPIAPDQRKGPLPLSFAQQRLWFIDQLEPESPLYNVPVALRIEGPLSPVVLALCIGEIVRRHEALRTVFAVLEGEKGSPAQVIWPAAPFALPVVDLSGLPETAREALLPVLVGKEVSRPFDLTRGPLLRGLLLRLAERDHAFAVTLHHIVSDGWSMGVLIREVAALYAAFAESRPSPLPELPVQYADFAVWQTSWLRGEVLEEEIDFWRRRLAGLPPLLELPTDRPRPAVQSYRGTVRPVRLPAGLARQMEALARSEGATLFMVLLAGFQALLARTSRQTDLAVGSPIAGRNRIEIEGLIGFFVNTLVLRGNLTGSPTFRELIDRARETALAAYVHQDVPFEKLVEEIAPERSLTHTPLFQVMLVLQNAPAERLEIRGLRLLPVEVKGTTAKFDLTLTLAGDDGALAGEIEYATDLFDAATVDRLAGHFGRLLAAAAGAPDEPFSVLPLLSPAERGQILIEWNDTASGTAPRAVYELFATQLQRTPEAVAVVFGNEELTYAGLDARASRLVRRLRRLGVGPDVLVGLMVERSMDMIAGVLGILQAGGVYVPLDPQYPAERLAFMLDDTRAPVLLTQEPLRDRLPAGNAQVLLLDAQEGEDRDDESGAVAAYGSEPVAENLGYVIYTSGSTGRPKGISLSQGALRNLIDWHLATLLGGARTLQFASLSFDASFHEMFACWGSGGTLVVVPEELRRDLVALAGLLVDQRIEKAILPVVVLQQIAEIYAGREDLPPLREITTTGERLQTNRAMASLLRRLPGCAFHNHYGPSETHVATAFTLSSDPEEWTVYPSIGRPIGNSTAYVLEPGTEHGLMPAPAGVFGDLYLGGECLARGYLGRPDLTAERFVPHPCGQEPGARLYRTGDKVRFLANGELDFLGRFDDQVKIRGFRIEPGEIEALLLSLPGVHEAVVAVREDRSGGTSGDRRLVAYVVGDLGDTEIEGLRRSVRDKLPDYMVPSAFVVLPELPLTPNGKVDRRALPAPGPQAGEGGYVAPRTPVEEVLAGICAEVLGLELVGRDGHFFELGGHSLLATRAISRLRSAFGIELPLRVLFERPTVAELAAVVEEARRGGQAPAAPPLVAVSREGPLPLSFAQERLWFLDSIDPGEPTFNMPGEVGLIGRLDRAALGAALRGLVERHEVLRTVFQVVDGVPRQHILPDLKIGLPVVDLAALPGAGRLAEAERLAAEHALHRFDLARGPLLDAALLRLEPERHQLLMVVHHVVCDGWSLQLLVREIGELYGAFTENRPSSLGQLRVQYADFAVWQRELVAGTRQEELAWWLDLLGGETSQISPLDLPIDRPRPPVQTYRGGGAARILSSELTGRLTRFGRSHGATLFMTLLAAIQTLLHRHSGQDDILVGAPVAGRRAVETEELIGCFLNTLVLRTGFGGQPGFRSLVEQVREVTLGAYSHQDVPFEAVLAALPVQRDLSRTPLFQVMVNLVNVPTAAMRLPGLELDGAGMAPSAPLSKLDMTLYLSEGDGGVQVNLVYNADLFDAARMEDLLDQLALFLEQALERPEEPVGRHALVTAASRELLPDPAAELSAAWEGAVHEIFARHARRDPGALAAADPAESWNYGELDERSDGLAAFLQAGGVRRGDVVAFWAHRSAPLVWGVLGALKAGATFLMLDPRYPAARQAQMLEIARPAAWLRVAAAGPVPVEIDGALDALSCSCRLTLPAKADNAGEMDVLSAFPAAPAPVEIGPDDTAYVAFTSGSTGVPKGVLGRHGSLSHFIPWLRQRFDLSAADRFSMLSGLAHDPLHRDLFTPLQLGAAVVIPDPKTMDDPGALAAWMRRAAVTITHLTPALGQVLTTEAPGDLGVLSLEVPSLRYAFLVGDVLTRRDVARLRSLAPNVTCVNYYGSTETQRAVGYHVADDREPREILPLGRGIPDVQLLVLNPGGGLAGIGEMGEVSVRSPHIALGYLGDPQLTSQRFAADLYRTGDLGRYLPNGEAVFAGRADTQVKIRGFRIELGEIESVLGGFPGVREAVVVVRPESFLAAYLVPAAGITLAVPEVRSFLRERLPEFMVPATFTLLAELPLTPNRKVDRKALPAPEWQKL